MSHVYRRRFDFRASRSNLFLLLAAASATAGTAEAAFSASGTLTGAGALSGSASLAFSGSASASAAGGIEGSSALQTDAQGTLIGQGVLTGASDLVFITSGTGFITAAFNPQLYPKKIRWQGRPYHYNLYTNRLVIFPHTPAVGISGQADILFGGSGVLTGAAALQGSLALQMTAAGTLRGAGALVGTAAAQFSAEGTLGASVSGDITGSCPITMTPVGTLLGAGAMSGTGALVFTLIGAPTSLVQLAGASTLLLSAEGTLVNLNAAPEAAGLRDVFKARREWNVFKAH